MRIPTTAAVLLLALAPAGQGQPLVDGEQQIDFDRPESWGMKYAASANLLTGLGVPRAHEPGSVELGFEGIWVPSLSEEERRVGFDGTKVEDIDRVSIFGRPRLLVGLPRKLSIVLSYVPPVEVFDIEPHLAALALGRPVYEGRGWRLGLRLSGQYGTLEGDFTCPAAEVAAGDDPELNPFGCEELSGDEVTIRSASVELSAALDRGESGAVEPYISVGFSHMDLDFQVDARYAGIIDRTRLTTDGHTFFVTLGAQYRVSTRWRGAIELFNSPLDVVRPPSTSTRNDALFNARAVLNYRIR